MGALPADDVASQFDAAILMQQADNSIQEQIIDSPVKIKLDPDQSKEQIEEEYDAGVSAAICSSPEKNPAESACRHIIDQDFTNNILQQSEGKAAGQRQAAAASTTSPEYLDKQLMPCNRAVADISSSIAPPQNSSVPNSDIDEGVVACTDDSGWEKVTAPAGALVIPLSDDFVGASPPARRILRTFYMVRIPMPSLDSMRKMETKMAELGVQELTGKRNFLNAAVRLKRAGKREVVENLKATREKEKTFSEAIKDKRKQADALHSALNRMRKAGRDIRHRGQNLCISEKELDDTIASLEGRIAHDTISLREEKELIREIRQLNASRGQVRANALVHAEIEGTFGEKEEIQSQLKALHAELDLLRKEQHIAACKVDKIEEECNDFDEAIFELLTERNAANATRQDAFVDLQILYNAENARNDIFYQNKREIQLARQYASDNNKNAGEQTCVAQMERVLALWTSSLDFRSEYVKNNQRSTLKRLGTSDGRALGPDEEPPFLISMEDSVNSMLDYGVCGNLSPNAPQVASHVNISDEKVRIQQVVSEVKSPQTIKKTDDLEPSSSDQLVVDFRAADDQIQSSPVPSLQRIIENNEVQNELEVAELEKTHLQERAKAKVEAEQRKKRQTEKSQARREKKKEKKARKKATTASVSEASNEDLKGEGQVFTEKQVERMEVYVAKASTPFKAKSSSRQKRPNVQSPRLPNPSHMHRFTKKSGHRVPWLLLAAVSILILFLYVMVRCKNSIPF